MNANFFDRFNGFGKKDNSESSDELAKPDDRTETPSDPVQGSVKQNIDSQSATAPPSNLPEDGKEPSPPEPKNSHLWNSWVKSVSETVKHTQEAIANSAAMMGEMVTKVSQEAGTSVTQSVSETVKHTGEAISTSATMMGDTLGKVPTNMGESVTQSVAATSQAIANSAATVGKNLGNVPKEIGFTFNLVRRNPLLKKLTKSFKVDALLSVLESVDIPKAEAEVRALQQQYPHEKPDEIAHRIIIAKALLVAGSGLASSLVPGAALALAGLDLATTTMLSAELVYQIAAAYGMDLHAIDRQGEALAIFGLSTGGNLAIQAGINLVGIVPLAGAVLNASASATMMYALGYGACRFYEANLNLATNDPKLEVFEEVLQTEGEEYLEQAIAQQQLMDWVLAHTILAGNPEKTWPDLLPELAAANFSPASLEAISAQIQNPPSIETLLEKIDRDFALVLLEQCQTLVNLDSKITPEESYLIQRISEKTQQKIQEAQIEQSSPLPVPDDTFVSPTTRKSLGTILLETIQNILTQESDFDRQELGYLVERVDLMSGEQFEAFLAECFQRLGYGVQTTPKTNDYGADLILYKDGRKTVVQAKRYQNKVDNSAVQQVVAAIPFYGANDAIVITNSLFTPNARELAKANKVRLWDREQLIDLILRAKNS